MRINIRGSHRNADHAEMRRALQWYAKRLIPDLTTGITLDLSISDTCVRDGGFVGAVMVPTGRRRPKRLSMVLYSGLSRRRTLRTLALEMVHVKQVACGELNGAKVGDSVVWMGVRRRFSRVGTKAYFRQPWESEAYGRQYQLLRELTRSGAVPWRCP